MTTSKLLPHQREHPIGVVDMPGGSDQHRRVLTHVVDGLTARLLHERSGHAGELYLWAEAFGGTNERCAMQIGTRLSRADENVRWRRNSSHPANIGIVGSLTSPDRVELSALRNLVERDREPTFRAADPVRYFALDQAWQCAYCAKFWSLEMGRSRVPEQPLASARLIIARGDEPGWERVQ